MQTQKGLLAVKFVYTLILLSTTLCSLHSNHKLTNHTTIYKLQNESHIYKYNLKIKLTERSPMVDGSEGPSCRASTGVKDYLLQIHTTNAIITHSS